MWFYVTLPIFTGLGRCPIVSWGFVGALLFRLSQDIFASLQCTSATTGYSLHQQHGNAAHGSVKSGHLFKKSEGKVRCGSSCCCCCSSERISITVNALQNATKNPVRIDQLWCCQRCLFSECFSGGKFLEKQCITLMMERERCIHLTCQVSRSFHVNFWRATVFFSLLLACSEYQCEAWYSIAAVLGETCVAKASRVLQRRPVGSLPRRRQQTTSAAASSHLSGERFDRRSALFSSHFQWVSRPLYIHRHFKIVIVSWGGGSGTLLQYKCHFLSSLELHIQQSVWYKVLV